MKYLLLPILKFLWAIFLTIMGLFWVVGCFLEALWEFEKVNFGYVYTYDVWNTNISPYFKINPNRTFSTTYYFKSFFHYIWGRQDD